MTTTIGRAVERLRKRNGMSEEAARARIDSQISTRERLEHADVRIRNTDTPEQLESRVLYHWRRLQGRRAKRRAAAAGQAAP